jgi:peptidoglycan/xylan/chitin deacetylase (PgdA/CDA1 family)
VAGSKLRPLVLAYHGLGDRPRRLDPSGILVPVHSFRAHVARLRSRGYEFVSQSEFARRLHDGEPPGGTVSLTFDDGSEDNVRILPELLRELRVPATVYACPGLLGRPIPWLAGARFMTEDELRRFASSRGVEIGSHTSHHTVLADATAEEAEREMQTSKLALETLLDLPVRSFSYPKCRYSDACPAAAERAGYTSAVTCGGLGGLTPYELARESPAPGDGPLTFELKSRGSFWAVRELGPVRVARWATRPIRRRG